MLKNTSDMGPNMFDGDKWGQLYARKALPILIKQAAKCQTISFKELATALNLHSHTHALNMQYVCGSIRTTLSDLESSENWQHGAIPHITSIVIRSTGAPAPFITRQLKKALKREPRLDDYQDENETSFRYTKWNAVLEALGLI